MMPMSGPTIRRSYPTPGDALQGEEIAAPDGGEPMQVTADASRPHERYRSVQKNGLSVCIGLWFDKCTRVKGDRPSRPAPLLSCTPSRLGSHRRCHQHITLLRYESVLHFNLRFAGVCQLSAFRSRSKRRNAC
jgi:hypothetical protein